MNTFHLQILASDKTFYTGECLSLSLPIQDGQYGILPGHCNMIAAVVPGTLTFHPPGLSGTPQSLTVCSRWKTTTS